MTRFLKRLSGTQRLTVSFLIVIFIGSILLSLPITHYQNAPATNYLDHLFTVVSMVCVTGLSVFPVAEVYNGLGQVIAVILMQIGGLGLVTLIAVSTYLLRRRMNLSSQNILQSALSYDNSGHLKRYLFNVYKITFIIESLIAILFLIDFIPRFGVSHGIFNAIFLAVSAFCNAGFDNLGGDSLKPFVLNPLLNLLFMILIVSGGIGFAVWVDIKRAFKAFLTDRPYRLKTFTRKLSNQTRLVLNTTAVILILGTAITWLLEANNPKTIGLYNPFQQFMVSLFQTVTMRTAGFATISYLDTHTATNILYMIQMIIGGAPGGTAGGIKVTTVAITFLLFKSELAGQSEVTYRHRIIANKVIKQTLTVLIFFFSILIVGYILLLQFEPHHDPIALLFEAVSAIATVGVSMDLTPQLSTSGRLVIMALMFIGRVGPLTVLLSLLQKKEKEIQYAQTNITVG
ncbi:potassium uptake transporter channel subunit KtrB [Streptococcus sp.]|uniref:potassium uptake transporter channel subunit KtrB n=1 Tax=Streptococcus sp. TaxID=1306 RepID=UPI0026DADB98|nr:potassium uptake transporter channel subunit KtrB [Streptococcus sp.]MDO4885894.1 potassium uptake transporter channel subunit KtrB [Streptococcus sp.]